MTISPFTESGTKIVALKDFLPHLQSVRLHKGEVLTVAEMVAWRLDICVRVVERDHDHLLGCPCGADHGAWCYPRFLFDLAALPRAILDCLNAKPGDVDGGQTIEEVVASARLRMSDCRFSGAHDPA